jgi:hypothetical protein
MDIIKEEENRKTYRIELTNEQYQKLIFLSRSLNDFHSVYSI